jgi:hypothetical protein
MPSGLSLPLAFGIKNRGDYKIKGLAGHFWLTARPGGKGVFGVLANRVPARPRSDGGGFGLRFARWCCRCNLEFRLDSTRLAAVPFPRCRSRLTLHAPRAGSKRCRPMMARCLTCSRLNSAGLYEDQSDRGGTRASRPPAGGPRALPRRRQRQWHGGQHGDTGHRRRSGAEAPLRGLSPRRRPSAAAIELSASGIPAPIPADPPGLRGPRRPGGV